MNAIDAKPKLVFFQNKYDERLPEFLLTHTREQVKCLSEFFDVVLINYDCDYQEACDKYQPDLALFESGSNILSCQRPKIANVRMCSAIPKLGFFNADAWCETRSATLSEMDHWGIETFFSIATTAAEHTPEIADKLFTWPIFIDPDLYKDYGESKLIPVLLTGATAPQYPWRRRIYKLISEHYPSLSCPHHGYLARSPVGQMMYGERYARTMNASLITPVCGTIAKEVVRKHFEIPGCKACMVTEKSPGLQAAGFVDMKNCVFADEHDVLDKVAYLFEHPEELQAISDAGYQLVHSRHTLKHRDQILQWFRLHKNLRAHEKIVQTSPFGPLTVAQASSRMDSPPTISSGSHLELLRNGDDKLSTGKYEEAETLYLQCLNYMRGLPEAKFRLALCNLYKGDPKRSNERIFELIQYTLDEYGAVDPDPVEWAYYILSLLCLGKLNDASKSASDFPWLRHPELDRARWAVKILTHNGKNSPSLQDPNPGHRLSIHGMPTRSNTEWLKELRKMLEACDRGHLAEKLTTHNSLESLAAHPTEYSPSTKAQVLPRDNESRYDTLDKKIPMPIGKKSVLKRFDRQLIYYKVRRKLKNTVLKAVRRSETTLDCFLPSSRWKARHDEFLHAIHELAREEEFKAVLIIGATRRSDSTEALLAGALENMTKPCVFCISYSRDRFGSLRRKILKRGAVKWYRPSASISPKGPSAELEKLVQKIKEDNQLDYFDVVLIDGSEFEGQVSITNLIRNELHAARFVLLDDINKAGNCHNHDELLRDSAFLLVDHNPGSREGYSIFKRGSSADRKANSIPSSHAVFT